MAIDRPVLRPGDTVHFDARTTRSSDLAGTSVRLRSGTGAEADHPGGTSDGLARVRSHRQRPDAGGRAVRSARRRCGRGARCREAVGTAPGRGRDRAAARRGGRHDRASRVRPGPPQPRGPQRAKAVELGVTSRTIESRRARYLGQGLWGLVDQRAVRAWEATGRADARLVDALREVIDAETDTSTGTRSRLMRRVVKRVEELHGLGEVPLPGRSTFHALMDRLTTGKHTFGSAVTRRQTAKPAGRDVHADVRRPARRTGPDRLHPDRRDGAARRRAPGPRRHDHRRRCRYPHRLRRGAAPGRHQAVDAALLLAKMLVPEPMRPGWANALRLSASRMPHARLLDVDARMREAAARPVIVPDQIVIDHGRVFVSETFDRACNRLGISVQPARKGHPD